jgi:hypothetical protein
LPPPPPDLLSAALKGESLSGHTLDEYVGLLLDLYDRRVAQAERQRCRTGGRLNAAIERARAARDEQEKRELQHRALREYEEQQSELDSRCRAFDARAARQLDELEAVLARERSELEAAHEKRLRQAHAEWTGPQKLLAYDRASLHLIVQRRQLELLLRQCRFEEAEQVQRLVSRLEEREAAQARAAMQRDYFDAVRRLTLSHERAVECLDARSVTRKTELRRNLEIERSQLVNREKMLRNRGKDASNVDKVWAMAQLKHAAAISRDVRTSPLKPPVSPPPMPRLAIANTSLGLRPFEASWPPRKR